MTRFYHTVNRLVFRDATLLEKLNIQYHQFIKTVGHPPKEIYLPTPQYKEYRSLVGAQFIHVESAWYRGIQVKELPINL